MEKRDSVKIRDAATGQVLGFVIRTQGGFFRAHSFMCGVGLGPFDTEAEATAWVLEHADAVPNYSRRI